MKASTRRRAGTHLSVKVATPIDSRGCYSKKSLCTAHLSEVDKGGPASVSVRVYWLVFGDAHMDPAATGRP